MKQQRRVVRLVEIGVLVAIVFAGFGSAVQHLWNLLMPGIFGLRVITYWEAVGLMGLSWILFGGLRGFGSASCRRTLPPEDRERLQRALNSLPQ